MIDICVDLLGNSIADSTRRTYGTGQRRFRNYCEETKIASVWDPPQHVLIGFVCWLHRSTERSPLGLAHGTMKNYLTAVRHAHVVAGRKNPIADCPALEAALRAIKRKRGGPKKPRLPVTVSLLLAMKEFLDLSLHDHRVVWAALVTGVFGLLRLGEMLNDKPLRDQDFYSRSVNLTELHLRQSKTDPFRHGCFIKLFRTGTAVDPVEALDSLVANRPVGLGGQSALTQTFTLSTGKVLTRALLTQFMRTLVHKVELKYKLGLNSDHFSGHSLRRGGATSLALRGVSADVIRVIGRWRSLCYRLYLEMSTDALRDSVARMAFVSTLQLHSDLGVEKQLSPNVPALWTVDDDADDF
jgi:hypothetical protein